MRIQITQPPDWVTAWKQQANTEGVSLSEWIGECCNANLPKTAELSERRTRGGNMRPERENGQ